MKPKGAKSLMQPLYPCRYKTIVEKRTNRSNKEKSRQSGKTSPINSRKKRWTKKNGKSHFGYKDHINIDAEYGFIRKHSVTPASVHDSQQFCEVLDGENASDEIWADSAYRSENLESGLKELDFKSQIHERAYRNHPLSEEQKQVNRVKSKVRAKVEHVFGAWVMNLGGKLVRCIGIKRVTAQLGLKDLTYNLRRYVFFSKKEEQTLQNQCV
jgi:transposase, IS5 family